MFAQKVQLACLAGIVHGTCEKSRSLFSVSTGSAGLWLCSLAMLCIPSIPKDAGHASAKSIKHPGSPTTPAAQLADCSALVRAAAGALAAKGDAAHPQALASAVRAMAHLGAPATLTRSALLGCFALPCPDPEVCYAQRPWCPAQFQLLLQVMGTLPVHPQSWDRRSAHRCRLHLSPCQAIHDARRPHWCAMLL